MSTSNSNRSDLWGIHNIIQGSMLLYPKEIIIATLRDFFSRDSFYHYSKDEFGFTNTTDHSNLPPGADLPSGPNSHPELSHTLNLSTRVNIGENYRYSGIHYPAILVKSGGSKSVQISFNRNQGTIQYENTIFEDGYGNETIVSRPKFFLTAGAWEGTILIDIYSRSLRARDDLTELVAMCFTEVAFDTLEDVGVVIKPLSISGTSEQDDRNDKLFRQTITLDIRTEWERAIPINNVVEMILFTAYFGNLADPNSPAAPNLTINTETNLLDALLNM